MLAAIVVVYPVVLADVPAALPARRAAARHAGRCCWWPTTSRSSTRWPAPGWCSTTAGCRTSWPSSRCSRASPARSCAAPGRSRSPGSPPTRTRRWTRRKADLDAGNVVVIYPEGSVTRDPDWWPMQARTGVARLALTTDAVVLPVAQWGPQRVHDYHRKKLHLRFRAPADYLVGEPIDLSAPAGRRCGPARPLSAELLRETTDLIMAPRARPAGRAARRARAADLPPAAAARAARRPVRGAPHDARRGPGRRLLGDDVREGARRRRLRRHAARPPAGAGQGDHRGRREPRLPARHPAARRRCAATADAGGGADGRRRSSSSPCPSQSLRDNLTELDAAAARRTRPCCR